jgi:hypothetical protein
MELSVEVVVHEGAATVGAPRRVEPEYTLNWAPILRRLGASLLVSTYQAGKLVVVSHGLSMDDLGI